MFYRTGVIADRSLIYIAGIGIVYLFSSCDFDLGPIDDLHIYELESY